MRLFRIVPLLLVPVLVFSACTAEDVVGPQGCIETASESLPEGMPVRLCLESDPEIRLLRESEAEPFIVDSLALVFIVTARDSTAHLNWWPTHLLVETDRGYREEILLHPWVCLEPSEDRKGEDYPLSYDWWSCNWVGVNNETVLVPNQIEEVEQEIGGRLIFEYELDSKSYQGAQYFFEVSVGRPSIQRAIDQISHFDYIQGDIYHPTKAPRCVLSDVIPPPPCPPWDLSTNLPISFEENPGDKIPVHVGGWVRATYTQPDGTKRSTTLTVPEP